MSSALPHDFSLPRLNRSGCWKRTNWVMTTMAQDPRAAPSMSISQDWFYLWHWRLSGCVGGSRKRKAENLRNSKVTSIALPAAMGLFLHPPHGAEGLCCHFKHHFILTKAGLYVTALKSEHLSRQQNRKTSNCSGYPKLQQPSQLAPAAHKRDH